ncbi:MAG: helix-turn-helix domain-containing protein [Bacteroidota bacterium]
MGEVLFTTHDVANILHVDKSTVKRWTDEGKLKCFRTPGGHRKFRSEDLYNFITENNYGTQPAQALPQLMSDEMIIRSIVHKKEYNVLHSVCFSSAIKGKKQEILTLFSESLNAGLSVASLFDNVVKPTVKKLGFLLVQDKLSISEFHLAQNVLTSSLNQLNETVNKQSRNYKPVVCASIENGKNDVELAAVMTLLEVNGYTAMNLGSGISAEAINQFVVRTKPFAVCLYTSFTENKEQLVNELKKVAELAKSSGSHCIVGGNAFKDLLVNQLDSVTYYASYAELESMQFGNMNLTTIHNHK